MIGQPCHGCPIGSRHCGGAFSPELCADTKADAARSIQSPGLLEKAGNLARAVVTHVADGGRIASPEVQAERKAICFSCSHLDKTRDACSACGCGVIGALSFVGMDMDKKRSWASSRCPLSQPRWEAV